MLMDEAPQVSLDRKELKIMEGRKANKNKVALKQAILYGIDLSSQPKDHRMSIRNPAPNVFKEKQA